MLGEEKFQTSPDRDEREDTGAVLQDPARGRRKERSSHDCDAYTSSSSLAHSYVGQNVGESRQAGAGARPADDAYGGAAALLQLEPLPSGR